MPGAIPCWLKHFSTRHCPPVPRAFLPGNDRSFDRAAARARSSGCPPMTRESGPVTRETDRPLRLALLLGGRSPEHDVSVASARSVLQAVNAERFQALPVAIDAQGRWLSLPAS